MREAASRALRRVRSSRVRVVLVEDHPAVRRAIREALSTPDIDVVGEYGTGEEAVRDVPDLAPDVLLLDLDLPRMSGLDVLRELGPRLTATQVVVLTVSDDRADLYEAIAVGAVGYLTKDIGPEALRRAVRGARDGDLPMPRRMAADALRYFVSRRSHATANAEGMQDNLSPREHEVLRLIADGLTDREIAQILGLSPRTVESHVANVRLKLGARNRAAAARMYRGG